MTKYDIQTRPSSKISIKRKQISGRIVRIIIIEGIVMLIMWE